MRLNLFQRLSLGLAAAGVWLAAATPVAAHPHVWITNSVTVIFVDGQVTALRHRWVFDEFFSSYMLEDYDRNGDGIFDSDETVRLKSGGFDNLQEFHYFTHVSLGETPQPLAGAADFSAGTEDGYLVYEFVTPLAEPLDPGAATLQIGVYDPTYYIDVSPAPEAAALGETHPPGCTLKRGEDAEHPIYYGMVNPPVIWLTCAGS